MSTQNNQKKNDIADLRDILFNQLKDLDDPTKDLVKELQKAEAKIGIGNILVQSAKVEIDAMKVMKGMTGIKPSGFIPGALIEPKKLSNAE